MKAIRLLSLLMALLFVCSCFISCAETKEVDDNIPEAQFYEAKVSFQVKNAKGAIVIDAVDYEYKWIQEPTILNILRQYFKAERGAVFSVDGDTITRIAGLKLKSKQYFAFAKGVDLNLTGVLGNVNKQNQVFIDKKMSTFNVVEEDCLEFTVAIASLE